MRTRLISLLLILIFLLTLMPAAVFAEGEESQLPPDTSDTSEPAQPQDNDSGQTDTTPAELPSDTDTSAGSEGSTDTSGEENNDSSGSGQENGTAAGDDTGTDEGSGNEENTDGSATQPEENTGSGEGSGNTPPSEEGSEENKEPEGNDPGDKAPEAEEPENKEPEDTDKEPEDKEPEEKEPEYIAQSLLNLRMADGLSNNIVEIKESNLGDFIADAYYYYFNFSGVCDAAFVRGTEICADVVGNWNAGSAAGILPNGRTVSVISVTGQQIIDALERGAGKTTGETSKQETRNPDFLQVAGLKYRINTAVEGNSAEGIYRVSEVQIFKDGEFKAIDKEAKYNVAAAYTQGSLAAEYPSFAEAETVTTAELSDAQILSYYVTHFAASEAAAMSDEETPKKVLPFLDSANSPLNGLKPGYPVNYESQDGAGRITIVYEPTEDGKCGHPDTETVNKKEATCTETGYTGDTVCSVCKEVLFKGMEIPMADHVYARDSGIYTWGADDTSCVLTATCDICGAQKNVSCFVSTNIIRQATNIAPGSKEVKASMTVNGKIYENSKVVTIPVREDLSGQINNGQHLSHVYTKDNGIFSWNADNSTCILTATCDECGLQTQIACVITTKVTKAETSVTAGSKTLTAKAIVNGKLYQQMKTVIVPAKNGSPIDPNSGISGTGYAGYGISGGSVATGDTNDTALYVILSILTGTGLVAAAALKKRYIK